LDISVTFSTGTDSVWFGGRLVQKGGTSVAAPDRLGSIGRYLPYGEERTGQSGNPANGNEKFATYTRDGVTGLDYADQRWYAQGQGRFLTSDPYQASGGPGDPASWNRYGYVRGDPVGRVDPQGLADFEVTVWGVSGTTTAGIGPTPSSFFVGIGAEMLVDGPGSAMVFGWFSSYSPSTTNPREQRLQGAMEWVRVGLGRPACRELFQGADPLRLLESAVQGFGIIRIEEVSIVVGRQAQWVVGDPVWRGDRWIYTYGTIQLNLNSSWANGFDNDRHAWNVDFSDDVFRAWVLLHELVHAFQFIQGLSTLLPPHGEDSTAYDRQILDRCFR
jgi:RHS repeat-associated protein